MKKATIITLFTLLGFSFSALSQEGFLISGKITDSLNKEAVNGASIKIKGTKKLAIAAADGSFQIKVLQKLPITLVISSVGFKEQEFEVNDKTTSLNIALNSQNVYAGQVVVTASRVSENILKSPVSIEKLSLTAIKETPSPSFYDAIENIKGVQATTLSLGFKVYNTRGFSGTTNSRFLQMVDGVDNISSGIGAPIANAVGPTELDIESVELIPGAASAVYGLNAINGISNLKTKSPFKYQGISVYQRTGVNHIDGKYLPASLYSETSVRFAKAFGTHFAFKVNGSYSQGKDWVADDRTDQYFSTGNKTNTVVASANPAPDLINNYGDEYNSDLKTIKLADGKTYDVSRTGYLEKDLTNYDVKNTKADLTLVYKFNNSLQASYTYRIGNATNNYQRGNRIRLNGEQIQQHSLEIRNNDFFVKAYYTEENTGPDSYNFRPLAENIDLAFKKPTQWYNDYTNRFATAYNANGHNTLNAFTAARTFADSGRYTPGKADFDSVKNKIVHTNNWDTVGAQLLLKSAFYHIEGQYDFSHLLKDKSWQILLGGNYRKYIVTPDGNEYINPAVLSNPKVANDDFYYYTYGGFVQASKKLLEEKLKLTASLRVDQTEYFDAKLNPRIAAVYSPSNNNNFRVSYQNGYRFPTLFEGFAFVNNGGVRRLGGLRVTAGTLNVFENSFLNSSVTAFKNAVNADINSGTAKNTAIQNRANLLVKSTYDYIQPEHLNSFEVGYKGILLDNKLFFDIDYYFNTYDNFIGQLDVTQPIRGTIGQTGGVNDSTAYFAYTGGSSVKKYKMWTNSKSTISNQGVDVSAVYAVYKKFNIGLNVSYTGINSITSSDAFTPAFNTPDWISNVSFSNKEVVKNVGFNIVWHWQNAFYWNSPLANGIVDAYNTLDAQVNYKIPSVYSTVKLGASNLLNTYHTQYIGGPAIGGFYYISFTFDAPFKSSNK